MSSSQPFENSNSADRESTGDATEHQPGDQPVVVVLDPTAPDGEAALDLIDHRHTQVALMTLTTGPCSSAIRDYARAENIDLFSAAWTYLEQVQMRLGRSALAVELIVATGPDMVNEIGYTRMDRPNTRFLLPESVVIADRRLAMAVLDLAHVVVARSKVAAAST